MDFAGGPKTDAAWLANAVARGYYEADRRPVTQMSVLSDALNEALRSLVRLKRILVYMSEPPEDDFMQGWGKDDLEGGL